MLENDPEYIRINRISEQLGRWLKRKKTKREKALHRKKWQYSNRNENVCRNKKGNPAGKEEEICGIYGYDYREIRTMMYKIRSISAGL